MTSARLPFSRIRSLKYAHLFGGDPSQALDSERPSQVMLVDAKLPAVPGSPPRLPTVPGSPGFGLDGQKICDVVSLGRRRSKRNALEIGARTKKPMTYESAPRRLFNLPPTTTPSIPVFGCEGDTEWRGVVSVLSAIDELGSCSTMEQLLRRAVEVARDCIGLERAGLYVSESPASRTLRGTWGTGASGELTDERELSHDLSDADRLRLLDVQKQGGRWLYFEHADHIAQEPGRSIVLGSGWLAITPLMTDGELVGVLYNDTAVTHTPIDLGKQVRAAVFCSLLAGLVMARRKGVTVRPTVQRETERGSVVRQVQRALNQNPLISGEQLARELNISAGYLARVFKTEVGVSLVEYRNRLRIERFLRLVERGGGNLYEAAIEAGFGSYAQFHRVFRRHVGTTPREYVTGAQTQPHNERPEPPSGLDDAQELPG